jgi:pimeloyl-ACP methyl ester carboxylesterase
MPEVELAAGTIDYEDTGGEGPTLVLVHGLSDSRHWRKVVAELRDEFRCVAPTLPLGSHRRPMRPDADLSLRGMGRILADFIEAVGLDDVTLCFSDWSCGQTMVADGLVDRVGRLVFVSCETADNYPPGIGGQAVVMFTRIPGGLAIFRAILGNPRLRPLPMLYGPMTKAGVPDDLMREWLAPLKRPEIRRDFRKYILDVKQGGRDMKAATPALAGFPRPVLVVWDKEGKMMPNEEGRKLAASFPDARLVELSDCRTLITEDQPEALANEIRSFVGAAQVRSGHRR